MAFLNLVSELTGRVAGLPPQLAELFVNRAWESIRDERLWSFLVFDGMVICPTQVTAGTAAITQWTTSVTLDAAASAALLPQTLPGAVPGLTNMAIRFGQTSPSAGQVYSIVAVDPTTPTALVLTLARPVVEATNPTSGYQVYRPYIIPPVADFLRWESVVDVANARTMTRGAITYTSADFDLRDPQRTSQGLAYYLGSYLGTYIPNVVTGTVLPNPNVAAGSPVYELWPHPTQGQSFYVRFRRRGVNFTSPIESQPAIISDNLIIQRALYEHVYPFAAANIGNFPALKGSNWAMLIATAKQFYDTELRDTKRQDDEQQLQSVWNRGHGLRRDYSGFAGDVPFPVDSNFLQSHLVRF